jgi:DnaA family protein
MRQIPLAIAAPPVPSFDSFLAVGANMAVVAHLRALGRGATPIYLWGPSGSGKTHLLRALAAQWQRGGERVSWFDAASATPWHHDAAWALVVLDECDRYDAAQQQAAFSLFVAATADSVALAAAGRLPPVDLPLRDDLRTRLGWGHVFALEPLPEPEVRAVLRREADRRGLFLSDDVIDYLLTRFARDLKHLMAMLERLDAFALLHKRAPTVPLLKQMLTEEDAAP